MSWRVVRLILLALLFGSCVSLERDQAVYSVWAKRGQTVGDLAHVFCDQGSDRERDMFLWAMRRASVPAEVTIICHSEWE